MPLHAAAAISPFPSELFAFGNSVPFGFWTGALLSWIGWVTAAHVHYSLVRSPRWRRV